MEAIILITPRQEKAFHKTAAALSIGVREEGSTSPSGKFYIVSYGHAGEVFTLGIMVGFDEGLEKSHQPSKELQN